MAANWLTDEQRAVAGTPAGNKLLDTREGFADALSAAIFDAAIIGGGINGACLYHRLCADGYRVALIDKNDFASGTSQASAMMVWGGLLYLGCLDLAAVYGFSQSRDHMIRHLGDWVSPYRFRFLPAKQGLLSEGPVIAALYLYWLIGHFRRSRPRIEKRFPEKSLLARDNLSLLFEEARVAPSDARFVLHWITSGADSRGIALNHCQLMEGEFGLADSCWHLSLRDRIGERELQLRTRTVINCGGVWTDRINAGFGIRSPYKHVFSKGVFLGLANPCHQQAPLIFDLAEHNDVLTSIPWGPIRLWGPTETAIADIEQGFSASPDDIRFLLDHYNQGYRERATKRDIVSIRCGIRPLAVKQRYHGNEYPLELSRRSRVWVDNERPWISVYGGKLTGCENLAASVARRIASIVPPPGNRPGEPGTRHRTAVPMRSFAGLDEKMPTIDWCIEHEHCCTLEDYLRRRTNIAQWIPRGGLGEHDEHLPALREMSLKLAGGDEARAERHLAAYRAEVTNHFDRVLALV